MRKKVKSLILVITALCCIAFAGCGKQTAATLEDLAASNADITKTIKEDITVPGGMTAVVEFSGDSFDIVYTYDDAVDDEDKKVLTSAFDANSDELKANCEEVISSLEQQTGITGITGNIIFKNSDGQELSAAPVRINSKLFCIEQYKTPSSVAVEGDFALAKAGGI